MNRRDFLGTVAIVSAHLALRRQSDLSAQVGSAHEWRTFEVTTRVEVLKPSGTTCVWLPAMISDSPFQKTLANTIDAPGGTARIVASRADALGVVAAEFPSGVKPMLTLTSRVSTRNYAVDLSTPPTASAVDGGDRRALDHFLDVLIGDECVDLRGENGRHDRR